LSGRAPLHLFTGFGVELEYMIVDRERLDVLPVTDELIRAVHGSYESEIEQGELSWSNELVLHVIELKTNGPAPALEGLDTIFQRDVRRIDGLLATLGGRLMPTGMHPWMDPDREMRLWPHEYSRVYESFHRIFDCRGHGWANLQSAHLNLPFHDDEEFGRLHAAIRVVLPLLPALAASTPIRDGVPSGVRDTRLEAYRKNSARIPSVAGRVIPERAFTRAEYERLILEKIYADLSPHDPEGVLRYEWANARGAIARFTRNTIEIRVLDTQECPAADLAVLGATVAVLRALIDERWVPRARLAEMDEATLAPIFLDCARDAELARIDDPAFLGLFGLDDGAPRTAGEVWRHLVETLLPRSPWRPRLDRILDEGTLATRILRAVGDDADRPHLRAVYEQLCECLVRGRMFPGRA
jgi:gamma-glutamyl:cysteine ligase YbdK (ATP-grasp superfamily)